MPTITDIDNVTLWTFVVLVTAGILGGWYLVITKLLNPAFDKHDQQFVEQQRRERRLRAVINISDRRAS